MAGNPIQYTSRTYQEFLDDINADPELRDKPLWWKRLWAGVGDVLNWYNNAQANQSYLRTASVRRAVVDLCENIDYYLAARATASGIVLFDLDSSVSFPVTIALADLVVQTTGSIVASSKRYEARASVTVLSQVTGTFTADHTTEQLTVARDFTNTEKIRLTTTGTLPAGLALATDYWVIRVNATTIKLATSRANALAGTAVAFSDNGSGTHTWNLLSVQVTMYQQTSVAQHSVGTANPATEWQEIDLADKHIIRDTLQVVINSVTWPVIGVGGNPSTMVFATGTDKYVQLIFNTDGSSFLRFGDGTYGEIPGAFDVYVEYAVGGGADANAAAGVLTVYSGSDSNVESVYNPAATTGGANAESIENAKRVAPLLLKARDRFVTDEDGQALMLAYGGLTQAKVNKNTYGVLSAQCVAIAAGGGNPSASVRTALQTHLINRTILEGVDVRVEAATITAQNVTASAKMSDGYVWADVEPFFDLAWKLFFSEAGREISDDYISNGTASVVTLVNSIFGTSFGAADYTQVARLVENMEPRQFGDTIQESDALGYIDTFVNGLDYLTVAAPAFPISTSANEITTDGTMTLTEIP